MTDDALVRGLFNMKALLMEAEERFGPRGKRVVALAMVMKNEGHAILAKEGVIETTPPTTEECYRFLCEIQDTDPEAWAAIMRKIDAKS